MSFNKVYPESFFVQEGVARGLMNGTPIYTDTADENNIYLGYCKIDEELNKSEECLICKIHINGNETIKYLTYGKWINRTSLTYK